MSQQQLQVQILIYEECDKETKIEISNHAYEFYKEFNKQNNCYTEEELVELGRMHDNKKIIEHDNSYGCQLFVAKINNEFAGGIRFNENFAYISHLYVSPKFRRMGLGTILLDYCERKLKEKNHKKVDIIVYDTGYKLLRSAGYIITKSEYSDGSGIQHTAYKKLN